jgi:hypothetical protein
MTAIAPALADQAKAMKSARGAIEEQPRGAGRDYLLASTYRDQAAQGADLLNKAYMNAFPAQAGIGTESGQVGLQQAGAGLRAGESAANINQGIMQTQQQEKATQLGLIGSVAGMGASAMAGGGGKSLMKMFSKPKLAAPAFDPMKYFHRTPLSGSPGFE